MRFPELCVKTIMIFGIAVILTTGVSRCAKSQERSEPAIERGRSGTSGAIGVSWNFELPAGWKIEATNQKGPLATWRIISDKTAPSGKNVLAMTSPNHNFGGTFNICWTDNVSFLDGEIEVRFKAVKGREDQGGGVIWRVQDRENYYIARFNPLENNFLIYYVRDGVRKTLSEATIELPAGIWHTIKIIQRGNRFEGWLNGEKILEGTNGTFMQPGGVGLWTKADSVTSFDDFSVRTKVK